MAAARPAAASLPRPPRPDGWPSGRAPAVGWRGHRSWPPRRPRPTGLGPRRPRSGCRPGGEAAAEPVAASPHRTCPRPPSRWGPGPGRRRPADQPALRAWRGRAGRQQLLPASRRGAGPRPDLPQAYPSAPSGYPGGAEAYPAGYPASGGYPADGRRPLSALKKPGGPARRPPAAGRTPARPGTAMPNRPAAMRAIRAPDGGRDYPASGGRHGYSAGEAERTDPGASRRTVARHTDPGAPGPVRAPGRTQAGAAAPPGPPRPRRQSPPPSARPASAGYPAAPLPRPRAGAVTVAPPPRLPRPRLAWATPTAATWTRPRLPLRPPRPRRRPRRLRPARPRAVSAGPAAGEWQQLSGIRDRPDGRLLGPVWPGPGSVPGRHPATGPPPAADARAEPGSSGTRPRQRRGRSRWRLLPVPGPRIPGTADYPNQAWLPRAARGTRDDTRYRSGQTEDPYGPDGYSGYHSRQGRQPTPRAATMCRPTLGRGDAGRTLGSRTQLSFAPAGHGPGYQGPARVG